MICQCTHPGHCPIRGTATTEAMVSVCVPYQPLPWELTPALTTQSQVVGKSCRSCVNRGEPVMAANGRQVGSEGCGCTAQSVASGQLWWTCNQRGSPVREDRAESCSSLITLP
jgi:hypothetical protein